MKIVTILCITAVVVGYILKKTSNSMKLHSPKKNYKQHPVYLICGDCSGEEETPVLTILMENGTCSKCDSAISYILAGPVRERRMNKILETNKASSEFELLSNANETQDHISVN